MKKTILISSFLLLAICSKAQTHNGLDFDGSDDFIQTNFSGINTTSNRTFEAWISISPNAPTTNLTILDYGSGASGARNTFMVNSNRGLSFFAGGTNGNLSSTTGTITAGQWTHVAFVLNNGTGFLYIDGVQVGTGNLSGVNTTGSTDLRIGRRVPGGNIFFAGKIDEVRIWDAALSETVINTNRTSEVCPSSSGLVAYYQFNEGAASASNTGLSTLPDLVNSNDGALSGFNLTGTTSNWVTGAPITQLMDTNITQNTGVLTAAQTGVTYQWIDCSTGIAINGETAATFTPTAVGDYAVELTLNGCTLLSNCENVITLGIDTTALNDISITQNPSQFLTFNGNIDVNAQISFYTLSGKEVFTSQITDNQTLKPEISNGLYMVTLSQNGAQKTFKWIKR